ncbi:flagellar motor switch protein FliN [Niallia taxi]|uniref:flagellar motor switch protein FliN n=1 Tax=Niallia taxi TaxID=2499688 RepID=UPI0015F6D7B9|nr:flagellar motor switch protein FliN [Niallia taxi]
MDENTLSQEEIDLLLSADRVVDEKPIKDEDRISGFRTKNVNEAEKVIFSNLEPYHSDVSDINELDLLLDVDLSVRVVLGKVEQTVKEILNFAPGKIVELDKLAGEPVDIVVNNKLIATGEVVVLDESFGVRVSEILDKRERLRRITV